MIGSLVSGAVGADVARLYDLALEHPPGCPAGLQPALGRSHCHRDATCGERAFQLMRWALIPHFHKKPMKQWRAATFNARSEEVDTKASFKTV
jgi:hypothetical protein